MILNIKNKIKVLIVDDSPFFRELLKRGIAKEPSIDIVATASNPYEARDMIVMHRPDVMTLDIELPKMNGIDFLKKLMPQYPIPVVVVSSVSEKVFEALNAGAVDFVVKSLNRPADNMDSFINELIIKIKIASTAKVGYWKMQLAEKTYKDNIISKTNSIKIIAIGASTGGTEAIYNVLKYLPKSTPGIVIVQHMPPVFTKMYAERLNDSCIIAVKEAESGDVVIRGRALIAPGGVHMRVLKKGNEYIVECIKGEKVNGHCPSADVLFDSVSKCSDKDTIGIILTGMGCDGAKGLLSMKMTGARTIGQDEESCVVYGMPKVAYEIGAVERQFPLIDIPRAINRLLN